MTRRGAIISGGWTAIVVAEDGEDASTLRCVLAESFEVGRIVEDEFGEKRREWTEADLDLAVRRAMQRFTDLRVESVVIEWATSKTSKAHALARAVKQACIDHDIAWSYAKRWRLWNATAHRAWVTRRLEDGYPKGWPSEYSVARDCGVMLLESIAPERPEQVPLTPKKEESHAPSLESSDAKVEAAPVPLGETRPKRGRREKPALPVVLLPRSAGIDPGSGYLGLVITEGTTVPVQLVHKATLPVGERVPLKRPRKIKRGAETFTLTTRHSLTEPMAKALAAKIVALLVEHRVTRLAIEHVESVHIDAKNPAAASSIATSLIRTSWLDMLIGVHAEAAGIKVHRVSTSTWRARVAGRSRGKRGGAGAELIPEAVASKIQGWPHDADEHERDAAGVNLWLVLPPPESPPLAEKKTRAARLGTPKGPREPGKRPASYYARLERLRTETAQARMAAGCECIRGRHRVGCLLDDPSLSAMDRKFLTTLAQHPSGLSKQKMLTIAGYRYGASVTETLERLRRQDRITGQPHELRITQEGLRALETG